MSHDSHSRQGLRTRTQSHIFFGARRALASGARRPGRHGIPCLPLLAPLLDILSLTAMPRAPSGAFTTSALRCPPLQRCMHAGSSDYPPNPTLAQRQAGKLGREGERQGPRTEEWEGWMAAHADQEAIEFGQPSCDAHCQSWLPGRHRNGRPDGPQSPAFACNMALAAYSPFTMPYILHCRAG
jgi:hypothetical protein